MLNISRTLGSLALAGALAFNASPAFAADTATAKQPLHHAYHRLLPLEGGSNFRDLGGYKTADGKTVVRGELFRSGAMPGLTETDMAYLEQFDFQTVVDLRSRDEIELFPNHWAQTHGIAYVTHDYGFGDLGIGDQGAAIQPGSRNFSMAGLYQQFPVLLKPQLTLYFDRLLAHSTPLVVNCSAGQDRTGAASALLLTALGVPRATVVEDYLLSTDYRRPAHESAGVDLAGASENNAFAKMMAGYREAGHSRQPTVLKSPEGTPYIVYLFDRIEQDYGSVENYLDRELGVDEQDIARLRTLYLN